MGFQDALAALNISYASTAAVDFADYSMEAISYFAILASTQLAAERGVLRDLRGFQVGSRHAADRHDGSAGSRNAVAGSTSTVQPEWTGRLCVRQWLTHGMRNSNCMAIAPTATISTIIGVAQSIEPMYKHLFVKSNLSGEFTHLNTIRW